MRRTLLSVLVAVVAFAVTSVALVYGFELVAGRSTSPAQSAVPESSVEPTRTIAPAAASSDAPDPTTANPSDVASGPLGSVGFGLGVGPSSDTTEPTGPGAQHASQPKTGLLSQDFRKLGIDDPTTVIDESLRSACDVVGGTVLGPALCSGQ
jgi:cytoskeletal protein RodZ